MGGTIESLKYGALKHAVKTSLDTADNTESVSFGEDDVDAFIFTLNAHGFEIIKKENKNGN